MALADAAPPSSELEHHSDELVRRPIWRSSGWTSARWVRYGITGLSLALGAEGLALGTWIFPMTQLLLLGSTYAAARLFSRRPLVDPVQGLLAYFYWWFGAGPIIICGYDLLVGNLDRAAEIANRFNLGALVVAIGLPFYGLAAIWTLRRLEYAPRLWKFLQPRSETYSKRTILLFMFGWVICGAAVAIAGGIVEVNPLGGTETLVWWVGILASCARFFLVFTQSALIWSLMTTRKSRAKPPRWFWMASACVLGYSSYLAIFSGSKGAIVEIGALVLIAYVTTRQQIPWYLVISGMLLFLTVVEPFVRIGRIQMQLQQSGGDVSREDAFRALLRNPSVFVSTLDLRDVDVESPFRGVYEVAGEIANRAASFRGPLGGSTITTGLAALVPRALNPGKPNMNVGNVFTHVYGTALGMDAENDVNNIAPSLPFEMVANYGLVAGVLCFPLIGVGWAIFCGLLLSPTGMANHPLAPWLVLSAGQFEGALGPILAWWRDLPFTLVLIWLIYSISRRGL